MAKKDSKQSIEAAVRDSQLVSDLHRRIDAAKEYKKDWVAACERILPYYRGEHESTRKMQESNYVTVYPVLKSHKENEVAFIHSRPPRHACSANNEQSQPFADVSNDLLSYVWERQRIFQHTSLAVEEAVQSNIGFIMCGFDDLRRIPTARYISADNVLIDPNAEHLLSDARWVAIIDELPLADVKADPRYQNTESLAESKREDRDDDGIEREQMATLYHIYTKDGVPPLGEPDAEGDENTDITPYRVITIAKDCQKVLRNEPWSSVLDFDEFLLTCVKFENEFTIGKVRGTWWGKPTQDAVRRLVEALDWTMYFRMTHAEKCAAAKVGFPKGFDAEARSVVMSPFDMQGFEFEPGAGMPEVLNFDMKTHQMEQLQKDIKSAIDEITGHDELMRGAPTPNMTATEAEIRRKQSQTRVSSRADKVETLISEIQKILLRIARFHMTPEDIANVLGPESAQVWLAWQQMYATQEVDPMTGQPKQSIDFEAMVRSIQNEVNVRIEPRSVRERDMIQEQVTADKMVGQILPQYMSMTFIEQIPLFFANWFRAHDIQNYQRFVPSQEQMQTMMLQLANANAGGGQPGQTPDEKGGQEGGQ